MWSRAIVSIGALAVLGCAALPLGAYEAKPLGADMYAVKLTTGQVDWERQEAEFAKRASATCGGAPKNVSEKREIIDGLCADCDSMKLVTTATITCEVNPA